MPEGYEIYRDNLHIGSSTSLQYVDRDPQLTPATRYQYHVTARWAAGSESPPSQASAAVTLAPGEGFYEILHTDQAPVIDGDLGDFANAWPASFSTSMTGAQVVFKASWDETALYVAYAIQDTDLIATCSEEDNGQIWADDSVELFLDLGLEEPETLPDETYMDGTDYQFIVNVLNARFDLRGTFATPSAASAAWDGDWQSAVQLHGTLGESSDEDLGFAIEARFPWSLLEGYSPVAGTSIGLAFTVSDADAGGVFDWKMWPDGPPSNAHQNSANWQSAVLSSWSPESTADP